MRFAFTDDQVAFRDAVADLLAKEDEATVWSALAEMGVTGLLVGEDRGGLELSVLDLEPILEEAGRVALVPPIVETTAVAPGLLHAVGGDVAPGILAGIASGKRTVSVGLDWGAPVPLADLLLLLGRDGLCVVDRPAAEAEGTVLESVDPGRSLVRVRSLPASAVVLGRLPAAAEDRARQVGAVATAAFLIGLSDRMLDLTVGYAAERRQFGVPIGSFQAIKHHLADALLALSFARPVVRHAAAVLSGVPVDPAHPVPAEPAVAASMAKAAASDAAMEVARWALQCHGAIGYTVEYELHRYLKRTWALAEAWGSAAWHREQLARRLLDDSR